MLACSGAMTVWCMVYDMRFGAGMWAVPLVLCVLSYPPWTDPAQRWRSRFWAAYTAGPAAFFLFVAIGYSALVRFELVALMAAIPLALLLYRGMLDVASALTRRDYTRWTV